MLTKEAKKNSVYTKIVKKKETQEYLDYLEPIEILDRKWEAMFVKWRKANAFQIKTDPFVVKLINLLMRNGKKIKAEIIFSKTIDILKNKYPRPPIHIIYLAVLKAKQDIAVRRKPKPKKSRRKHSYDVYIPRLISHLCGLNLGMRSIVNASRERSRVSFSPFWESLSYELYLASQGKGEVVKKRGDVRQLAIHNKRKLHYGYLSPSNPDLLQCEYEIGQYVLPGIELVPKSRRISRKAPIGSREVGKHYIKK